MINKARLIRLTQKVLSMDSQNPPGNELALARFIEKDMRSLPLKVKTYPFAPDRPNVIAVLPGTLPRKKAQKEALLLTPHMDTVPVGQGWKYHPFGKQIQGGRIYGRGATDDKGNLAVCMEVIRSLVEDKVKLKRDVIMAATVDEETGSHDGIIPLLKKKLLPCRAALILDSDEYDCIIAQKGLLHARIQIFGKKAHGAYNWRGKNAIEIASRVINKLKKHKFRFRKHLLIRPPTINIGTIQGGDKVNIVADFCEFSVDIRFMPSMTSHQVIRDIKKIVKSETNHCKLMIDDIQQPYEIDKNHPFVKTYIKAARSLRIKSLLKGSEGATVMTFFKKHKIPAFASGFGARGTAHTTDEYAHIKTLYNGARLLERFVKEYDRS